MEAGTMDPEHRTDDLTVENDGDGKGNATTPPSVFAAEKEVPKDAEVVQDATAWLMESDGPTADEVEPTILKLNVGTADHKKIIEWHVVPIPDEEFRKARRAAMPRAARRGSQMPGLADVDETKYHSIIVAAATVFPDLKKVAESKGVADTAAIVRHRFAARSGLIGQISGTVSDISGYDETDLEVVSGNS